MKYYKIRVQLNRKLAIRNSEDDRRFVVMLDGKEMDIASNEFEFFVENSPPKKELVDSIIERLSRIKGTVGVENISVI